MKKIIFTAVIISGLLASLAGCENAAMQKLPPETAQLEQVSMRAEHGYTKLRYGGMEVNPQNYYTHYDVDDKNFVNEIWNALNYVEWTEYDGKSTANVTIELIFTDENGGAWRFDIDPNGVGWVTDITTPYDRYKKAEPIYYTAPDGVYKNVSKLLTEYSAETANDNVTVDTIKEFIQDNEDFTFDLGETHFYAPTSSTGDFTDEWRLDEWAEITLEDGPLPPNSIRIHSGADSRSISIYPDELFADVTYHGRYQAYSISEEITNIIQQQFNAFREAYEQ